MSNRDNARWVGLFISVSLLLAIIVSFAAGNAATAFGIILGCLGGVIATLLYPVARP